MIVIKLACPVLVHTSQMISYVQASHRYDCWIDACAAKLYIGRRRYDVRILSTLQSTSCDTSGFCDEHTQIYAESDNRIYNLIPCNGGDLRLIVTVVPSTLFHL